MEEKFDKKFEEVKDAKSYELKGLSEGSEKAQILQQTTAQNLPLEVRLKKTGIAFRLIPAGSFMMGSPTDEERRRKNETQHKEEISNNFYMGKFEISKQQWLNAIDENIELNYDLETNYTESQKKI